MLKLIDIYKTYKTKSKQSYQALNGVSIEFPNKGFVFITGKSGSGKSTLLNIIGGLDGYDSGEIIIKGKSSSKFRSADFDSYRNTYVGFVFQEFNLLEDLSLGKNIQMALELQSYKGDLNAQVDEILNKVELFDKKNNKINEISGGQKQRVAIARALVKNPEIIIADEPTGNLDSETGIAIMKILKNLSKEKLVIMVTHDVDFAAEYADRIIEMKDGVVFKDNTKSIGESAKIQVIDDTSRSGNKILYVPKNVLLQGEIAEQVNALAPSVKSSDLYISISSNDEQIKVASPNYANVVQKVSSAQTIMLDYTPSTNFKLIKSKLPFKDSFIMAFKSLFVKKVRLIFTIILLTLAFMFFGMSETIRNFNFTKIAVTTAIAEDFELLQFGHSYDNQFDDGKTFEDLKQKFPSNSISKIYYGAQNGIFLPKGELLDQQYSYNKFPSFGRGERIELTTMRTDVLGTGILYKDENILKNNRSVYISDIFAGAIVRDNAAYSKPEELLGKEIHYGMPIGGIYNVDKTGIYRNVEEIYRKYFDKDDTGNYGFGDKWELLSKREKALVEKFNLWKIPHFSVVMDENLLIDELGVYYNWISDLVSQNDHIRIGNMSTMYNKMITFASDYQQGNSLKNDEIVVNEDYYINLTGNVFDRNTFNTVTTNKIGTNGDIFKIVGILPKESSLSEVKIFFSKFKYDELLEGKEDNGYYNEYGKWSYSYIARLWNNQSSQNLVTYIANERLIFSGPIANIYTVYEIISILKKVLFYASLVTTLFAAILLFTNISGSVMAKKKEIGTLRAIGARGWDVAKIFTLEALIISLFIGVLTIGIVFGISAVVSSSIAKSYFIYNTIAVRWFVPIEIVGLAVVVAVISAYMPVWKVARMKPIDAIKNK